MVVVPPRRLHGAVPLHYAGRPKIELRVLEGQPHALVRFHMLREPSRLAEREDVCPAYGESRAESAAAVSVVSVPQLAAYCTLADSLICQRGMADFADNLGCEAASGGSARSPRTATVGGMLAPLENEGTPRQGPKGDVGPACSSSRCPRSHAQSSAVAASVPHGRAVAARYRVPSSRCARPRARRRRAWGSCPLPLPRAVGWNLAGGAGGGGCTQARSPKCTRLAAPQRR